MATFNDTLTQQLRRIRVQKALSIESIAEKLGLNPDGYVKIENGETELTLNGVENIAKVLGVSLPELLNTHSSIIGHHNVNAETSNTHGAVYGNAANTTVYVGVSSEVLEKLLNRIDTLEAELTALRKQL